MNRADYKYERIVKFLVWLSASVWSINALSLWSLSAQEFSEMKPVAS